MPTEGPLVHWSIDRIRTRNTAERGIYDLLWRISREYDRPIIEITESGCGCLDSPVEELGGTIPDQRSIDWYRQTLAELARDCRCSQASRLSLVDSAQ